MPLLFDELREQLLLAGVAPRHVRRYLAELSDHLADLRAETDDEPAALARLGTIDDLAEPMLDRPELRSWCARAPWAVMVLGPVLMLIATAAALLAVILAIGGVWFLVSPWQMHHGIEPMGLQAIAQALLAGLVFIAPVLIGWGMSVLATQRRLSPLWPLIGLAAFAVISGTFDAEVIFPKIAGEHGELRLGFGWAIPSIDQMTMSSEHWIANLILIVGFYLLSQRWAAYRRSETTPT